MSNRRLKFQKQTPILFSNLIHPGFHHFHRWWFLPATQTFVLRVIFDSSHLSHPTSSLSASLSGFCLQNTVGIQLFFSTCTVPCLSVIFLSLPSCCNNILNGVLFLLVPPHFLVLSVVARRSLLKHKQQIMSFLFPNLAQTPHFTQNKSQSSPRLTRPSVIWPLAPFLSHSS